MHPAAPPMCTIVYSAGGAVTQSSPRPNEERGWLGANEGMDEGVRMPCTGITDSLSLSSSYDTTHTTCDMSASISDAALAT